MTYIIFCLDICCLIIRRPAESIVGVACECVTGCELLYLIEGETSIWSSWGLIANKYLNIGKHI